jgi:uroporphyrinogen decarboxylase
MNSKERVLTAISHKQPDRTPADFQAVNEIWQKLMEYFHTDKADDILEALEIDLRSIGPVYNKPVSLNYPDGSFEGWGGSLVKMVENKYGAYEEISKYALGEAETKEDVDRLLKLPDLNNYDFSNIAGLCDKYDKYAIMAGDCSIFYFTTFVRSMQDLMIDMSLNQELAGYIIGNVADWLLLYHKKLLAAGSGKIDIMYLGSDFSTQYGLLFSMEMFRQFFREPIKSFIKLGKSYGAKIFFHICGSAYHMIPELISLGIDILDPVQTSAVNMEPERLKKEFGGRLTFHGAVDTQELLPHGSPAEVKKGTKEIVRILGKDGGYLLTSCHALQADVPVENILALYDIENRL